MKSNRIDKIIISNVVLAALFIASASHAALISVQQATDTIAIGDDVTINICVSELGMNEDVSAFDIDLNYDETVLAFSKYEPGNEIGNAAIGDALDLSGLTMPGQLNLFGISLLDDFGFQGDAVTIASVTFRAIGRGISRLSLSVNSIGDAYGNPIEFTINDGSITSVPEPATLIMLSCCGMFFLAMMPACRKKG